jgi:hypothetical protein
LPRSTLRLPALLTLMSCKYWTVATSSLPSLLKSATASEAPVAPTMPVVAKWAAAANPPAPLPSRTLIVLSLAFDVTRSSRPSLLKSAAATAWGFAPTEKFVALP